jgi:two-component system response regulator VanR
MPPLPFSPVKFSGEMDLVSAFDVKNKLPMFVFKPLKLMSIAPILFNTYYTFLALCSIQKGNYFMKFIKTSGFCVIIINNDVPHLGSLLGVLIMGIKILLVEDDEHILNSVKAFLENEGYFVEACDHGDVALEKIYVNKYHLAILDIMLPGTTGHTILKELRSLNNTPVLMLSALSDSNNQIKSFDNEADDYVTKPFEIQLLLKRVEALLRRSGALSKEIRYNSIVLYPEDYKAVCDEKEIPLTLKEFEILLLLMQNKNRTMSHEAIMSRVYGYDFDRLENTVQAHIKNLRAKLPTGIIKTVRGVGYRLEESQ